MARLEELTKDSSVQGILPGQTVTVIDVRWYGDVVELTYKNDIGALGSEMLYRDDEVRLEIVSPGRKWSFDGDGHSLRLVSEAHRISLAYLFDPLLAVHTSVVDPLPHQITAVYESMLPRQPLRFLLADDPGAGKTIMAGLYIRELIARGDLNRCLIVTPGSLVEQWQDELWRRFHLRFDIVTRTTFEESHTGNPFLEKSLVLARLDHLSRNDDVQAKLEQSDWDLVIVDEAHKMSASFFSGEVKETKRHKLGRLLGGLSRHFLLMTATPHNGKEEDFQLFMALLDSDRFEGRFRDGVHQVDVSDLMRRMVKEKLLKFDGTRLFPERIATTVTYALSDLEAQLYSKVTDYVREEWERADRLVEAGEGRRRVVVGFALTTLQRRLASSPEAIYQSLRRRRERLEKRLSDERIQKRGHGISIELEKSLLRNAIPSDEEDLGDFDEDVPAEELEEIENEVVDQATAARTIIELEREIETLRMLETLALKVRNSGRDRKWEELSRLLQDEHEIVDAHGHHRKLIIFTEHRDTLNYLHERIETMIGNPAAVVEIHGGTPREQRRKVQEAFSQDKDVLILLATDAAGEGVNLQRAHLMVNYDLPWNPNRLEQRFGRIHRIGQTEVCHLWNLVAEETQEGYVFKRLFEKLEAERVALGGEVFDVLGQTFQGTPLRDLLVQAVRYGEREDVRAKLYEKVDAALDHKHLEQLIEGSLASEAMDTTKVMEIREEMERAQAQRLQPHFIESFFLEAFKRLGGQVRERETRRYEIMRVPIAIRNRDRQIGRGEPVLDKYERIAFEKDLLNMPGKPMAAFICPGHPLLDATIDLILEQHRELLKRGAVLVNEDDWGQDVRALVYLEHAVQDGRVGVNGQRRVISKKVQFVEIDGHDNVRNAGPAPYLDYRPLFDEEREALGNTLDLDWLRGFGLEKMAMAYAAQHVVPMHVAEVRRRKEDLVNKTRAAVRDRLTKEINYWDHRASDLRQKELAGNAKTGRLNSDLAQRRADELQARLKARMDELEQERHVSALPPVVIGGALVVPNGLLQKLSGQGDSKSDRRDLLDRIAIESVLATERALGHEPRVLDHNHPGYDIESQTALGTLRFIEVKGKSSTKEIVTISKTQILTALNAPDEFVLAIVIIDEHNQPTVHYARRPFRREPDFGAASVNYELSELLAGAERQEV